MYNYRQTTATASYPTAMVVNLYTVEENNDHSWVPNKNYRVPIISIPYPETSTNTSTYKPSTPTTSTTTTTTTSNYLGINIKTTK